MITNLLPAGPEETVINDHPADSEGGIIRKCSERSRVFGLYGVHLSGGFKYAKICTLALIS